MNRSYEPGLIGSNPGARSDFLDRLDRATPDIIHRWHAALADRWGPCAEAGLKRLTADRETGLDALSLLRRMLADGSQGEADARRLALAAVRRPEHSIADLFVEVTLLADAVERGLLAADLPRSQVAAVMAPARDALNRLYADVLETTAVIYERAIETGGRGFCRIAIYMHWCIAFIFYGYIRGLKINNGLIQRRFNFSQFAGEYLFDKIIQ